MSPEEWRQVRELFEAALDEAPPDPHEWLRERKAASAIRNEVVSLLEHHSRAGDFLRDSVVERLPSLLDDDEQVFEPGAVVGHYRIDRELGRGAMGRVYRATDTRLGRDVALKALAPHLTSDPSHRERLRREARAAAALTHSGICTVYALEEIDGQLFIASELIEGRTLRDEMSRIDRRSVETISSTARELVDALASAHAKGVVHRDLKPENIMRNADGRLKILDFGLARIEPGRHADAGSAVAAATVAGALVGTPAYMSPEQLNGQPADARSDVFAYGVVMYEYACGTHPFDAATPLAVAARVLESAPAPLASHATELPSALAAVIDRCLRKPPSDRFESAIAAAEALRTAASLSPASSSFVTVWRVHQVATMMLYTAMTTVAWWIKELFTPNAVPLALFVALGIGSTAAGVMRAHLIFTSAMNAAHLSNELRRLRPILVTLDVLIAAGGGAAGLGLATARPLAGMLTTGLAIGLALATLIMEPATTTTAFGRMSRARR